jgi:hypothetical protein
MFFSAAMDGYYKRHGAPIQPARKRNMAPAASTSSPPWGCHTAENIEPQSEAEMIDYI